MFPLAKGSAAACDIRLGMKTAVSLLNTLFRRTEALRRRLGKSRSQLYREALLEYVARREPGAVTAALDEAVAAAGGDGDAWAREAAHAALERSEW